MAQFGFSRYRSDSEYVKQVIEQFRIIILLINLLAVKTVEGCALMAKQTQVAPSPFDDLFIGAVVGATVGVSANALWSTLHFAAAYLTITIAIHVALQESISAHTKRLRPLLYLFMAALIAFATFLTTVNQHIEYWELVWPIASDKPAVLIARTLSGGVLLLPFYRWLSTNVRKTIPR